MDDKIHIFIPKYSAKYSSYSDYGTDVKFAHHIETHIGWNKEIFSNKIGAYFLYAELRRCSLFKSFDAAYNHCLDRSREQTLFAFSIHEYILSIDYFVNFVVFNSECNSSNIEIVPGMKKIFIPTHVSKTVGVVWKDVSELMAFI